MDRKVFISILIVLAVIVIVAIGGGTYYYSTKRSQPVAAEQQAAPTSTPSPAPVVIPPATATSSQVAATSSSRNIAATPTPDTSGWKTKAVTMVKSPPVCFTVKYPSSLPVVEDLSGIQGIAFWPAQGTSGIYVIYDLNKTLDSEQQVIKDQAARLKISYQEQDFNTSAGIKGAELTFQGNWEIMLPVSESGKNFLLTLTSAHVTNSPQNSSTYQGIGETMAKSIVFSCGS